MKPGDSFRDFQVVRPLGGANARVQPVFLGKEVSSGAEVVIKTFDPRRLPDPKAFGRFRREAEVYRTLDHPNIVRYLTQGVFEGVSFIVLERVDGRTLEQLLQRGRVPIKQAVSIVEQLLAGLDHAHGKGILHRDIQPNNVMLTYDGRVKLLDFGVAAAEDALLVSQAGKALHGSFRYAAPEHNKGGEATVCSDLYSVGTLLWELLTGRPAVDAEDLMEAIEQQSSRLPPPSTWSSAVSPDLDNVCARLLAADPSARFSSAKEVLGALAQVRAFWGEAS